MPDGKKYGITVSEEYRNNPRNSQSRFLIVGTRYEQAVMKSRLKRKRRRKMENCRQKENKKMIPQDPIMLLSFVNLKLRDHYPDPDTMCEDLDISRTELEEKLKSAGYIYDREQNRYR